MWTLANHLGFFDKESGIFVELLADALLFCFYEELYEVDSEDSIYICSKLLQQ